MIGSSSYYLDYIKNNSYAHGAWTFPRHFVGSPWICDPFPWEYLLPIGSLTIVISMRYLLNNKYNFTLAKSII